MKGTTFSSLNLRPKIKLIHQEKLLSLIFCDELLNWRNIHNLRLKVKIARVTSEARKSINMAMKEKRCDQQIMAIKAVNKKNYSFAPQAQN